MSSTCFYVDMSSTYAIFPTCRHKKIKIKMSTWLIFFFFFKLKKRMQVFGGFNDMSTWKKDADDSPKWYAYFEQCCVIVLKTFPVAIIWTGTLNHTQIYNQLTDVWLCNNQFIVSYVCGWCLLWHNLSGNLTHSGYHAYDGLLFSCILEVDGRKVSK